MIEREKDRKRKIERDDEVTRETKDERKTGG